MTKVLPFFIADVQAASVEGRQILDSILVAAEAAGDWSTSNKRGFLLKLDYKKAYDMVNWEYLDAVLEKKGFGGRWRMWIMGCVSTVNFSILINGRPRVKIHAKRGLRPDNPISPFLFSLTGDFFSRLVHYCCEKRMIWCFEVGSKKEVVSHLQYTDDTIIFCLNPKGNLDKWWVVVN